MVVNVIAIVMFSLLRNNCCCFFLLKIFHQTLEPVLVLFCCTLEVPNVRCWICEFPFVTSCFDTEAQNHRTHPFKDPYTVGKKLCLDSFTLGNAVFGFKYDDDVIEVRAQSHSVAIANVTD